MGSNFPLLHAIDGGKGKNGAGGEDDRDKNLVSTNRSFYW